MAWDEATRATLQSLLDLTPTQVGGFLDDMVTDHGSNDGGNYIQLTPVAPNDDTDNNVYPGPIRIQFPTEVVNGKSDNQRAGIVTTMRKNFQGLFPQGTISAGRNVGGVDIPLV